MTGFETVTDGRYGIAESPLWDYDRNVLLWTDIDTGSAFELDRKTGSVKMLVSNAGVSAAALNERGLVFAGKKGIHFFDGSRLILIADQHQNRSLICNDAIADVKGRFLFGTIYYNEKKDYPLGSLYTMDTDGSIEVLDEGFHHVNGLGFSPDNKKLYFTDTAVRSIYAYDYDCDSGSVKNRRVFVKVPDHEGIPDGLTVDAQGYVWSAQWYGGSIMRYDPCGAVERRINLPVFQTSSLAFGGEDLTDIYVTTAARNIKLRIAPRGYDFKASNIGGAVYRLSTDIKGKKEHRANIRII